ncbi:thiamine-phosphate kinase [Pigmentiphaga sp. H8]|uniref:thiamine-phosphate kinase n=1 Tax=Pigmentiphaga sp. H8 TaxID=2488560 RepID=UPI000F5976B7|nr:thiamine-phosphate kinase [Pigmentiphaga sp. H8]AZG10394.1 thiamine-phosphate kinase [Pigmentiphaga sp. H8]
MGGEFELIRRHFTRTAPADMMGVGDDCALLAPSAEATAVSTDLLVEGRHFFPDVDPRALGHKSLAVNLSDLAAMGAKPTAFVLGLALPRVDDAWLSAYAGGLFALADAHGCFLVGGDTTRSDAGTTLSITIFGSVPAQAALRRSGARHGDDIWVSGMLGDADLALRLLLGEPEVPVADRAAVLAATRRALEWPEPRVALGLALRGLASAAIDISDGLLQDLGHILAASGCGGRLCADDVPVSPAVAALPPLWRRRCALGGGDAYELCFTAPADARSRVADAAARAGVAVTRIGAVEAGAGLRVMDAGGNPVPDLPRAGFDHFPSTAGLAVDSLPEAS